MRSRRPRSQRGHVIRRLHEAPSRRRLAQGAIDLPRGPRDRSERNRVPSAANRWPPSAPWRPAGRYSESAHESGPVGRTKARKSVREWGTSSAGPAKRSIRLSSREIENYALDRATKMSGSGFICFTGAGARLERTYQFHDVFMERARFMEVESAVLRPARLHDRHEPAAEV